MNKRHAFQGVNRVTLTERATALARRLEELSGRTLDVVMHRNRWTYFSCQSARGRRRIVCRLHEAFLDAPDEVIGALARMIRRNDPPARRIVGAFVDEQSKIWDELSDRKPRTLVMKSRGAVYDLQQIYDELNKKYFDGKCRAKITWGRGLKNGRFQSQITFGSYEEEGRIIRIHPALDRRTVPEYFVRYVIYHEMLHAVLPASVSPAGRRLHHGRLFRQREQLFEDYHRAMRWEKRFLSR